MGMATALPESDQSHAQDCKLLCRASQGGYAAWNELQRCMLNSLAVITATARTTS